MPQQCNEGLLIAMEKTLPQQSSNPTTSTNITFANYGSTVSTVSSTSCNSIFFGGRRGNAAFQKPNEGPRSIINTGKRQREGCTPFPLKRKSLNFMKNITVTHVTQQNNLETIYDVPINITELGARHKFMTVDDVQFEVKNQVGGSSYFIITDKKGNPIPDTKSTRGISLF